MQIHLLAFPYILDGTNPRIVAGQSRLENQAVVLAGRVEAIEHLDHLVIKESRWE